MCLSCRCPQFLPFGLTLQMSDWGLTWVTGLFPACGTSRRLFFLSLPGSCWLCITVSSTSSPFCQGPRWPCFAAMSPRSPIYSGGGGGGRPVSCSRHRCPRVPPLGGISSDSTGSAVPSGDPQCSRGLSLLSSPAPQFRMVPQLGRISIFAASVAGDVRPVCHFRPSPLLHLFSPCRDPLSAGTDALLQSWDGLLACAFPPWSVLPRVLAKLGCLTGPSSPSSPSSGLSVLGSWTSSSCRWLLQCLFQCAQTSSSSIGLVAATRVSTGWPFMPGDCPAPHLGG